MRDPYLYEDSQVLRNKLNIKDQDKLDEAEADYVVYRLKDLAMNPMPGEYNTEHLLKMHHYIFQDLYDWAGEPRVIAIYKEQAATEFCDSLARLWKVHPFREGNTRTTITFCCQYADEIGLNMNREIFEKNSRYVRTALVAYNAYFADGSNFSKKEYLERIVYDAISG